MEIIAKTFAGLEKVLSKEIEDIGGENIQILKRSVSFNANKELLYRANYVLRTALKIIVPIFDFKFKNIEDFYEKIFRFEWFEVFKLNQTFVIEANIFSDLFKNTNFAALKAKDAIVDRFKEKYSQRPNVEKFNPDIKIDLYVKDNYCSFSLNSSGEPLFKRGYRKKQGKAPLNEVLAAGLIELSEWDYKTEFLDFMCGSGTIPIEAALKVYNIPSQFKRNNFGFQKWLDYEADLWKKIVKQENAKQVLGNTNIFASDISGMAIDFAAENIANAGLSVYINIKKASFDTIKFKSKKHILFNPPYGKRIGGNNEPIEAFYKKIGDVLKQNFTGSVAWIFTGNIKAIKKIGLKSSKKIILFNGPIESRLVRYELY